MHCKPVDNAGNWRSNVHLRQLLLQRAMPLFQFQKSKLLIPQIADGFFAPLGLQRINFDIKLGDPDGCLGCSGSKITDLAVQLRGSAL